MTTPDDYARGYTSGHAAGRQAAYDGEEPRGYGQALRDMTARALAAEESVEVCKAMIGQLVGDREMDEARGRAHGLLVAAILAEASYAEAHRNYYGETTTRGNAYWEGVMDEDESLLGDLAVLADGVHRDE